MDVQEEILVSFWAA